MAEDDSAGAPERTPFNELMVRVARLIKVTDQLNDMNPDFIAKVAMALAARSEDRAAVVAQGGMVMEALAPTVPEAAERKAVTSWFLAKAMQAGFLQTHRMLLQTVRRGGRPTEDMRMVGNKVMLPSSFTVPGFSLGPWHSPRRAKALRAVQSLGNPHGLGLTIRDALNRLNQSNLALRPDDGKRAQAARYVRAALASDGLVITTEAGTPDLLEQDVDYIGRAEFGSAAEAVVDPALVARIREMTTDRAAVNEASLKYWASTLGRLGISSERAPPNQ